MIDQLLDFCKLYSLARSVRGRIKIFCPYKEWKEKYEQEERNGFAILQREKRLTDRKKQILSTIEQKEKPQIAGYQECDEQWKIGYFYELCDIDEKLAEVQRLEQFHQQAIYTLFSTKKNHTYHRDVMMARKCQYSFIPRRDKPYIWLKHQDACARSGGCCSRECGCCEKPLKVFPTTSSFLLRKKEVKLYGHCTSECGCCIKHIGTYTPHYLFKKSEDNRKKRQMECQVSSKK
ncbi:hypothetical protein BGW36DRAFT_379901 [Talaromyces proteolyticus]|uniref:Uncharacterized protein n=1 Tax=Talaromyces proteolyticus TaxID=1131652 RepID=A0AAD4KQ80_9EURO|nr:uncharacterized protein BGW36DRAFT_379901 [Talaromyces proteolyticus]KAH8695927.1 hypothetical protein BGW36DRAFT_379901 [Talaromyces proteolyticus]